MAIIPTPPISPPGGRDADYARGDVDPPLPPPDVLQRYNVRVLDPTTAMRRRGDVLRPTLYVADELIVQAARLPQVVGPLTAAAARLGLQVQYPDPPATPSPYDVVVVKLAPGPNVARTINAWAVLQRARALAATAGGALKGVQLNRLLSSTSAIGGQPFDGPHSPDDDVVAYGGQNTIGRRPITLLGRPPAENTNLTERPTIAVLDTGCGDHPWLRGSLVLRDLPDATGLSPVGLLDNGVEDDPDEIGPLDGRIDRAKGHGTMICGLIRQVCPDANVISIRLMDSEGFLREDKCITALNGILDLVTAFRDDEDHGRRIDVLTLCFGYFLEDIKAFQDNAIRRTIRALGCRGVIVVASAGNHATIRPMFPAALTPLKGGPVKKPSRSRAPVIGVGALNPDETVALFSNSGPNASAWAPGVNVASTFPAVDAGAAASGTTDPTGQRRQDLDPDNFHSGFALWSGTSMAAPIIAGRLAQAMLDDPNPQFGLRTDAATVKRAWFAVEHTEGIDADMKRP